MTPDEHWRRFRASGDPSSLGALFDAVSPELFRVALSLAPDAASAEDALQETWLVALRSAARHDPARPVVPWLVGILRRKVHEGRRAARRPDERRLAPRSPADDPSIVGEAADDARRVRASLDALPASCREVAVLRWRYGLEPGEIADARRMPPGTVRSLLHRALVRLRRDLKAAPALVLGVRWPRGLGEVRQTVIRAAAAKPGAGLAASVAGGLLVAKATKTAAVLAAACLLLGASAVWTCREGGTRSGSATSAADDVAPSRVVAPRAKTATIGVAAATAKDNAPIEKPFARGVVVDESGAPIPSCRVVVRGHEDMGGVQDAPVRVDAAAAAVTGADGRFVVPKKPDDLASLTFVADGFEAVEERSFDTDLRVVLPSCGSFAARVVDTAGEPIAGADVRVMGDWLKSEPRWSCVWLRAATDASGRFEFRSLPKDARLTTIQAWGYRLPGPQINTLPEQDVYVLERSCLIVDVTDARTHAPIADARGVLVGTDGSLQGSLEPQLAIASTPARAGRLFWSRSWIAGDLAAELRVFAPGHRTSSRSLAISADAEPPRLRIALEPGDEAPMLAGRVEGGAGALVAARFTPRIPGRSIVWGEDLRLRVAATATAGADGSFAIVGIPPGRYRITVTRAGDPPFSLDADAPATSLSLRFPGKAVLDLRYADTAGRPVANAWFHVQTTDERFGWELRTDAEGRACFDALPTTEVDVIPSVRGIVTYAKMGGPQALEPSKVERRTLIAGTTTRIDLVRPDRCRVTVVVREDTGNPVRDAEIRVDQNGGLFDQEEVSRLKALDLTTDAAGCAAFEVYPCRGEVKALRHGSVHSATFYAEPGSAPLVEIVIPTVVGRISGRVVERGTGAAVTARPVTVWWNGRTVANSVTGDDGRFVAVGVPAGRVRVSVQGSTDANDPIGRRIDPKSPYGFAEIEFDLAAGGDHALAMMMPRIKGDTRERAATAVDATVVDETGAPVEKAWLEVKGRIDRAWCSLGEMQTDAAGRAHLDVVAAERYVIKARRPGSSYRVGEKIVDQPQASVERDAAPSLVERFVLPAK